MGIIKAVRAEPASGQVKRDPTTFPRLTTSTRGVGLPESAKKTASIHGSACVEKTPYFLGHLLIPKSLHQHVAIGMALVRGLNCDDQTFIGIGCQN